MIYYLHKYLKTYFYGDNMVKTSTAKTLTGITKIHMTPDSGRINMTFTKTKIKKLKKMSIDLEMPLEDVIGLAIDILGNKLEKIDFDEVDAENIVSVLVEDEGEPVPEAQ